MQQQASPQHLWWCLPTSTASLCMETYLAGSCRFERGKHKYAHVLDGDGYVCSFSFDDQGRVHFRSAYVKTRCTSSTSVVVAAACN